jgi:hypothetical protein
MKPFPMRPLALASMAALVASSFVFTADAYAARNSRNVTRTSVNKNVNVNTHKHVDVDVDVDRRYHPVGTALAVGATVAVTSAVVGSIVNSVPPSCVPVQMGAVMYQQCGSSWYQPQYAGSTVQYVVVNPPR